MTLNPREIEVLLELINDHGWIKRDEPFYSEITELITKLRIEDKRNKKGTINV